jgi:hypothetical protein
MLSNQPIIPHIPFLTHMSHDDLEENAVYRLLLTSFRPLFEEASRNRQIFCIPATSIDGDDSDDWLRATAAKGTWMHSLILKPSPFFRNEFLELGGRASVAMDRASKVLLVHHLCRWDLIGLILRVLAQLFFLKLSSRRPLTVFR